MNTPAVNSVISTLGPEAQIIAHAMQQYGLVLADIGSPMYVTGTSAAEDANNNIQFTWNMNDVLGLRALTAGDFQVVNLTPKVTALSVTSGSAGSTLAVIGQNFSGAAGHLAVFFGNTAATSVTFVDDSHISAVIPNGSGTVDVRVQAGVNETDPNNPNDNVNNPIFGYGISATSAADRFTYGNSTISGSNSTDSFATSTVTAGNADVLTILVKDTSGNLVSGLTNSAFSLNLSGGTSTGAFGAVSETATKGTYQATFTGATAGTASTLTVTVSGVTLTTKPAVTVTPPAAAIFVVTGFSSPITAGAGASFTVTAEDRYGNVATGYRGTITFRSSDNKAVLPANYTFVANDNGVHSFSAILKKAAPQSITATDRAKSTITGTQSGIVVNAGSAVTVAVTVFPTPTVAGVTHTVAVTALDLYGKTAASYRGTIHFSSTDPQAVLPANYTFTSSDAGAHTFRASTTLKTAGKQSISATDTVTSSITGTLANITVNPAAAARLVVSGFPSSTTAGAAHTFIVTALDAFGNLATGYTATIHLTSSDGQAVLPANYTFTSLDNGSHTFSATLNTIGTQSIVATDTSKSTITDTETGIQVTAATLDELFRDWTTDSDDGDDLREIVEMRNTRDQVVAARMRSAGSFSLEAGQGIAGLCELSVIENKPVASSAAVGLGLYWWSQSARPTQSFRKRELSRYSAELQKKTRSERA
ncbi:MAG TPA: IPT/TIG domain-containing protein [Gemmataceae bacterium]|nr:IPT/TIG domain-containing protein [Gemmataceae bacterium]